MKIPKLFLSAHVGTVLLLLLAILPLSAQPPRDELVELRGRVTAFLLETIDTRRVAEVLADQRADGGWPGRGLHGQIACGLVSPAANR